MDTTASLHRPGRWRAWLAGMATLLLVAAGVTVPAAPASATVVFDPSQWKRGTSGWNSKFICIWTCQSYTTLMNRVDVQGPIGNVAATPKAGERFYVHVETSIVYPFAFSDAIRMQVLMPDGLRPSIQSPTDVVCTITDTSYNYWRDMGAAECQDPVVSGFFVTFPAVELSNTAVGEVAHFWFPVVADRSLDGSAVMQLTSDMVRNPGAIIPDPILSEVYPVVDAAPPPPPPPAGSGGTGGSTGGAGGTTGGTTTGGTTTGGTTTGTAGTTAPAGGTTGGTTTGVTTTTTTTGDPAVVAPAAPAGMRATSSRGVVTVRWQPAAGSPTGYQVQVSPDRRTWRAAGRTGPAVSSLKWRKGVVGKRYFLRSRAVYATGPGPWSAPVRVRVR